MSIDTSKSNSGAASDLEARLGKAADFAVKSIMKAVGAVGRLADSNQTRVAGAVDKAGQAFDKRTHGKYAPKVAKVADVVNGGVAKTATYRDR